MVEKADLNAIQEKQETVQVIGELSQSWTNRLVQPHLEEANKKRQEAEKLEKSDPVKSAQLKTEAQAIETEYGLSSNLQMGIRAATAALQGLATGNANQAAVGLLSPYANKLIKEQTTNADGTVNKEANLIAHAVLGAVEAHITSNNAAAGALGAFTAEAAAPYLMKALYNTEKAENLTDSQKQNIANLSQIAAGLAGGVAGNSTADFISRAEIGKRAVENNGLLDSQVSDLFRKLETAEKEGKSLEDVFIEYKQLSDKQFEEIQENCNSALCRYGVEKLNEEANQKALELVGFFNSRLSTLSDTAQERFIEFVIEENAKEIDFINGVRTPAEKAIVFLVDAFVENRENQGLDVSPKIASFAKKVKNPNTLNKDWKYLPAPKKDEITGIKGLTEVKRKTPIQGGGKLRNRWKDSEGNIYEWDSQHGTLEKYNPKGKHLGEFNYKTGEQTKIADPTRRVEP